MAREKLPSSLLPPCPTSLTVELLRHYWEEDLDVYVTKEEEEVAVTEERSSSVQEEEKEEVEVEGVEGEEKRVEVAHGRDQYETPGTHSFPIPPHPVDHYGGSGGPLPPPPPLPGAFFSSPPFSSGITSSSYSGMSWPPSTVLPPSSTFSSSPSFLPPVYPSLSSPYSPGTFRMAPPEPFSRVPLPLPPPSSPFLYQNEGMPMEENQWDYRPSPPPPCVYRCGEGTNLNLLRDPYYPAVSFSSAPWGWPNGYPAMMSPMEQGYTSDRGRPMGSVGMPVWVASSSSYPEEYAMHPFSMPLSSFSFSPAAAMGASSAYTTVPSSFSWVPPAPPFLDGGYASSFSTPSLPLLGEEGELQKEDQPKITSEKDSTPSLSSSETEGKTGSANPCIVPEGNTKEGKKARSHRLSPHPHRRSTKRRSRSHDLKTPPAPCGEINALARSSFMGSDFWKLLAFAPSITRMKTTSITTRAFSPPSAVSMSSGSAAMKKTRVAPLRFLATTLAAEVVSMEKEKTLVQVWFPCGCCCVMDAKQHWAVVRWERKHCIRRRAKREE